MLEVGDAAVACSDGDVLELHVHIVFGCGLVSDFFRVIEPGEAHLL